MAYAMGRMPYVWGEDAEDFRPERWLKNGIFQPESPFKFIAFHEGPRICLGKDFAYRQMKIVSTALFFFFRFKLADETKNVTYRTMFTLHMDGGLPLRATPRTARYLSCITSRIMFSTLLNYVSVKFCMTTEMRFRFIYVVWFCLCW
ncbi:hypothetical protein EV1_027390 [Malus domestica]